jgi:ACT domain-containing protein
MNAVLSVVGKDTVGILANVANKCAEYKANVIDVSQTVINEYFAMFMFDVFEPDTNYFHFCDYFSV